MNMQQFTSPWFVMMVGLPGSGKSTLVGKFINPAIFDLLSTDLYIETMASIHGLTYNEAFPKYIDDAQKAFNRQLQDSLDDGFNIVHDQTNLTMKKRKRILDQIPSSYYKVCVWVSCPFSIAMERSNRPGKIIPEHVMKTMNDSLQEPKLIEGFDDVIFSSSV